MVAEPEVAVMRAVPDEFPALNVVVATPLRVCASTGFTVPRLAVKRTVVPLCTGVPACSRTNAETSVDPPSGNEVAGADTVIVDSEGASN